MKKLNAFIAGIFLLLVSLNVNAQDTTKTDYFAGKWSVVAEGTPNGDAQFLVNLQRKDGKLVGTIDDPATGKETSKIDKVEEKEKSVTVYFVGGGFDVYLFLEKKDEDNVTGSLMDMFEAVGKRVKDSPAK
ncbi:hypothetical protein [Sphingobacterium sp. DR205]|uniref:hypothetical protein n=1 Tax=Sphingobacterium sp. DR205 TaxID=2713573 RepID=UPI0013E509BA|nr:hypothetical protein [Sphingobacterium sp. DR205]QIH35964.1 hypothetical protein G6053_25165 [Sphingobacterium sp. DR205]